MVSIKSRREHCGVAWHRKLRECLDRYARQCVEHVALAGSIDHVVEESAELRACQLNTGVSDNLDKPLEIGFNGEHRPSSVEYLQRAAFLMYLLLSFPLSCPVAEDFDESNNLGSVADRTEFSNCPEPAPVFTQTPTFFSPAASMPHGIINFAV